MKAADSETLRRVLRRKLTACTANTITDPAALRDESAGVATDGYAIDREEITGGLICVTAPVTGASAEVEGAMSCTFPSYIAGERSIGKEINAVRRHAVLC